MLQKQSQGFVVFQFLLLCVLLFVFTFGLHVFNLFVLFLLHVFVFLFCICVFQVFFIFCLLFRIVFLPYFWHFVFGHVF